MVLHNRAVEHNVARFSGLGFQGFLLLYAGREGQAEPGTMSNSANLCQFVNSSSNLAEKVNTCPLNQGH